jgi:hypothetical protein
MKIMRTTLALAFLLAPAAVFAITPAAEVYLASVGRGQGACPGGVCAQWRTSAWVTNLSTSTTANVEIAFLLRGQANLSPATVNVSIAPGESREFLDIFADTFGLDGVFGALRLRSNIAVAVYSRTFDANVQTNKGTGSAGQDVPGIPFSSAIIVGQSTELAGLAQDSGGLVRSNFGFVEAMGQSCTVDASLLAGNGTVLATKTYNVLPYEALQPPITDIGGPLGTNQRVLLTVTGGNGAIIATASRIDNGTGDPTTSDMTHAALVQPGALAGTWTGMWFNTTFSTTGTATLAWTVDVPGRAMQTTVTLTGSVFGAAPPPPQTLSGTLSPRGFTINQATAFLGTVTTTIDPKGLITGQATPPSSSGIAKVTFFGYTDGKTMTIAYFITFTAAQGGGQAGGYANLTKL